MKRVLVCCIALLSIIIYGCQTETVEVDQTAKITKELETIQKGGGFDDSQSNELVILYPEGTTDAEKQLKRAEYGVEDYKRCECADPNLELWIFGRSQTPEGGIEDKKATAKLDDGLEGAEFNPNIKIQEDLFIDFGGVANSSDGVLKRVAVNQNVTVAVLDTGVMYDYEGFTGPFLYNASQDACNSNGQNELFGWNFVEDNNNPYDNHYGRHGTIVTNLIMSKLDAANVNYQILPVKVANRAGNIRYFDGLCGFQYAAKKQDVKIINTSFGWYHHERELLQKFIEDVEDRILVVSSAGNHGVNNDEIPHYPSSYNAENIIAVAGLRSANSGSGGYNNSNVSIWEVANLPNGNSSNSALADFSNRGQISVDIAAPGEQVSFMYNNQTIYVDGTSFSAALTSGYAGSLYTNGMTASSLKASLLANCQYDPKLFEIKYSKRIPE